MTHVQGMWLAAPETQRVMRMLENAGFDAYAVGGCVRNALLGAPVSDIDISTDARPETVMALARDAGLRAVPTGIDHGTVTVIVRGEPFEITTFRADIETHGRRAVVRFADDIAQDAIRRDFTMNALYADRHGRVIDPLGGLPDLESRRLRFIEDPEARIHEDYLRILRFFRFNAWYGDVRAGMDADALAAIAVTLDGLDILSRERVWTEVKKLLAAPDPVMAVNVMEQTGVLVRVLPGAVARGLGPLTVHEAQLGLGPDPMRRLAVLGFEDGKALRLSRAEQNALALYRRLIGSAEGLAEIAWRHGAPTARDVAALRAASFETPLDPEAQEEISQGAKAVFPIAARDLMPALSGPALGARMAMLEHAWIASGFALSKADLLALPDGHKPPG